VRVRILLPGKHIDSEAVRLSSKASWGELLEAGVEIHEYQPTMMHTKLLIIDGELVSVGSTNFDVRSFRLNDEASLNVYDRDFATRMTAVFEKDLRSARVLREMRHYSDSRSSRTSSPAAGVIFCAELACSFRARSVKVTMAALSMFGNSALSLSTAAAPSLSSFSRHCSRR
jgi:phosphatidylserine/phosphatidylglycerophosphate/cardiolipin synthase-like enzyme